MLRLRVSFSIFRLENEHHYLSFKKCISQRNLIRAVNHSIGKSCDLVLVVRISNQSEG